MGTQGMNSASGARCGSSKVVISQGPGPRASASVAVPCSPIGGRCRVVRFPDWESSLRPKSGRRLKQNAGDRAFGENLQNISMNFLNRARLCPSAENLTAKKNIHDREKNFLT